MVLTKEELAKLVYDPGAIQKKILEYMEDSSEGTLKVSNPTNPFIMLLEATATVASNSIIEAKSIIRKKYPSLAFTKEDLYPHISDDELSNMFAQPAEVYMAFYINILDLKTTGHAPAGTNYVETIIPTGTEVSVLDTSFTLVNDINIKIYENGNVFVEQLQNENTISIKDLGILNSGVINDKEGIPWIVFETRLKQIKKITKNLTVVAAKGFKELLPLTDKYYFSETAYKNKYTGNNYTPLNKSHNEEYINPYVPTVYITMHDNEIVFKIPDVYLVDGVVSGNVSIDLYETKGSLYLPINKYQTEDYQLVLGDTGKNIAASTSVNIAIMVNSRHVVQGGSNGLSLEELRTSVVHNTTGVNDLPITSSQVERLGMHDGYSLYKAMDVITERLYLAAKSLPSVDSKLILAKQDLFFNSVKLVLSELSNNSNLHITPDKFIIKSNTVFKEVNNVVTIVDDDTLNDIQRMSNVDKINYLKANKLFYTPYYYVVSTNDDYSMSRVYDLDRPTMDNLKILGKNINVSQRVNIDLFTIVNTPTGYKIYLTIIANEEFKRLDRDQIHVQLSLLLLGGSVNVYLEAVYDENADRYSIDIISDLLLDDNGYFDIKNGESAFTTRLVNLVTAGVFYIYTSEASVLDESGYLVDEISKKFPTNNYVVFSKETIKLEFGKKIEYIWNRLHNTYSERMYKTYNYDLPLVHKEDIYLKDPETGSMYICNPVTKEISTTLLHSKGDPVMDNDNNPVYQFRKGDIMLSEHNQPIVDVYSGIIRFIDIMMLEYEFKLANTTPHINYCKSTMDVIDSYLCKDMCSFNQKMLENTTVLYRSYKSTKPVVIKINNILYSIPYKIKPDITLYVSSSTRLAQSEIDIYADHIGKIIDNELVNTVIELNKLKNVIINELGENVLAVKITGIEDNSGSEVLKIHDGSTRLVMQKKLDTNKNNELIVRYDLNINVQYT